MDLYFQFLDETASASIEVWDGSGWQAIWNSPQADVDTRLSFDVSQYAVGNGDFNFRFNYELIDQWLSIDNVDLTVDVSSVCTTSFGPSSVPDGRSGTSPLRADRASVSGDEIQLIWDVASCTATNYNLLYGDLSSVASYAVGGSECSLGVSGSFGWSNVPGSDLYFLVVGTDGAGTESSWGTDSLFGERNGQIPSGQCGVTAKDMFSSCP